MNRFYHSRWFRLGVPALLLFLAGVGVGRFVLAAPPQLELFGEARLRLPADSAILTGRLERADYRVEDAVQALEEDRKVLEQAFQEAGYPVTAIRWEEVQTAPAGSEIRCRRQFQIELDHPEKIVPLQLDLLARGLRLDCRMRYRVLAPELGEQLTGQALESARQRAEALAAVLPCRPDRLRVLEVPPPITEGNPEDPILTLRQQVRVGVPLP